MIHVSLSDEAKQRIANFLKRKIEWAKSSYRNYHTVLIPKYRRIYEAQPMTQSKVTPWIGAANVVVPIAQIMTDQMQAKYMSAIFQTQPLWVARSITELAQGVDKYRSAREKFMNYVGLEHDQLDLYRLYSDSSRACISLGTDWVKAPWTKEVENAVREEGMGASVEPLIRYEGPQPHRIPLENMFVPWRVDHEDNADWIFQRIPNVTKDFLMERRHLRQYYTDAIDKIITIPDNNNPSPQDRERMQAAGINPASSPDFAPEWEVYECHLKYWQESAGLMKQNDQGTLESVGDQGTSGFYRLIITIHPRTETILRAVYNFYPKNGNPYVAWRFILRDEGFPARGFAEVLEQVQIAATQVKNNRLDNGTIANTRIWKAKGTKARLAAQNMFPNAIWLVDNMDDIEPMQAGDVNLSAFNEEASNYDLADRMTGVGAPMGGQGSGAVGKTRGVYTALGTMSLLQTGNSRSDIRICDLRYSHMLLGNKVAGQYSHFGVPKKLLENFGDLAKDIQEAFQAENFGRLCIPIRAATASINREVERQNRQLLFGQVSGFYKEAMQLIGAMGNAAEPMPAREYQQNALGSMTLLMRLLLEAFDFDDTDRFIATPPSLKALIDAMAQQSGGNPEFSGQSAGGSTPGGMPPSPGGGNSAGPGPRPASFGSPSGVATL